MSIVPLAIVIAATSQALGAQSGLHLAAPSPLIACPAAANAALPPTDAIAQMRCVINVVRTANGRAPLRNSGRLDRAAGLKADAIRRCGFTHTPCGEPWFLPFKRVGYLRRPATLGENLAWGTADAGSPLATVNEWLASPPHRENLLAPAFRDAGLSCQRGAMFNVGNATLWVLDLGRRH